MNARTQSVLLTIAATVAATASVNSVFWIPKGEAEPASKTTATAQCLRCKGSMEAGLLLDYQKNSATQPLWATRLTNSYQSSANTEASLPSSSLSK
jgi:hypothetical protein